MNRDDIVSWYRQAWAGSAEAADLAYRMRRVQADIDAAQRVPEALLGPTPLVTKPMSFSEAQEAILASYSRTYAVRTVPPQPCEWCEAVPGTPCVPECAEDSDLRPDYCDRCDTLTIWSNLARAAVCTSPECNLVHLPPPDPLEGKAGGGEDWDHVDLCFPDA